MKALVSIALATYNGAEYLEDLLNSVYQQTYRHIEVIACDDCSTDGTIKILKDFKKKYGLSFCVNDHRLGFVKNFEKAISMCRGDYIALCDQDDVWLPQKIETLLSRINGKLLVSSDLILVNKNNEIIDTSLYRHTGLEFKRENQLHYLIYSNFVVGCTALFKKELKQYLLPFPEGIPYHDWWIAFVAAAHGGVEFCEVPLVRYRYHGKNNSQTGKKMLMPTVMDKVKEVNKKLKSSFYEDKYNWLKAIYTNVAFSNDCKKYISEAITIYEGLINKTIPVRATYLAFKNRKFIFPKRGPMKRVVFSLGMIFSGFIRKLHNNNVLVFTFKARRQNEVSGGQKQVLQK